MTVWSYLRGYLGYFGRFYGMLRGCLAIFMAGLRDRLVGFWADLRDCLVAALNDYLELFKGVIWTVFRWFYGCLYGLLWPIFLSCLRGLFGLFLDGFMVVFMAFLWPVL